MNLAPDDLDALTRTVVGEAGNQPDQGQQAVASTVFNRLNAGGYGNSIPNVVLAPKQFSSWNDPRKLIAIDQNSKEYKRAAGNVQAAAADGATDYSGGATHFYAPSGMPNGQAPSWAKDLTKTAEIGGHRFYGKTAQVSDADIDRELQSYGLNTGTKAAPAAPSISDEDVDKGLASFGLNTAIQPAQSATPGLQQSAGFWGPDGKLRLGISTGHGFVPPPEGPSSAPPLPAPFEDVKRDIVQAPGNAVSAVSNAFSRGTQAFGQGYNALKAGDVLPSDIEWKPGTTTTLTGEQRPTSTPVFRNPGGLAQATGGAASVLTSPLAALNPVSDILTKTTGDPEFGSRATMLLPTGAGSKLAASMLPESRALQTIIEHVGRENIPSVLQRLESNPRLSLMDVSEPMRTFAGGLASDPELGAQNIMRQASDARLGARKDIVQDAISDTLGRTPNVKKTLDQYKANIRAVGADQIQPIVEKAGMVDLSPVIKSIDDQLGPTIADAVKSGDLPALSNLSPQEAKLIQIRRKIVGGVPESDIAGTGEPSATMRLVDASQAHKLQSQLRSEASSYMASADGAQRYVGGTITMPIRQQIVDAIDANTGGAYKEGLTKYREANQIDEAFQKGFSALKAGGLEDFPEYWKAWKSEASKDEIKAAQLGTLTALRRSIEGMQNGVRRGETAIAPDFIRDRVETLFGPKRTENLTQLLQDARDMSETNARLYQGSKTATTTAAQNALRVRQPGATAGSALTPFGLGAAALAGGFSEMGLVGLGAGALRAGHIGTQYVARAADRAHNAQLAQMISAGEGPLRDKLMESLRNAQAPVGQPTFAQRAGNLARSPAFSPMGAIPSANVLSTRPGGRARDGRGRFTSAPAP